MLGPKKDRGQRTHCHDTHSAEDQGTFSAASFGAG